MQLLCATVVCSGDVYLCRLLNARATDVIIAGVLVGGGRIPGGSETTIECGAEDARGSTGGADVQLLPTRPDEGAHQTEHHGPVPSNWTALQSHRLTAKSAPCTNEMN